MDGYKSNFRNGETSSKYTSPNRKYRKARDCKYESRVPHYLPAPEIISLKSEEDKDVKLIQENIESPQKNINLGEDLISEKLFSILRESPDRMVEKKWRKRAKKLGVQIYDTNKVKKSLDVLLYHCQIMVQYVAEVEGMKKVEQPFKVTTIGEIADIFEIKKEGKTRDELLKEIFNSLK